MSQLKIFLSDPGEQVRDTFKKVPEKYLKLFILLDTIFHIIYLIIKNLKSYFEISIKALLKATKCA